MKRITGTPALVIDSQGIKSEVPTLLRLYIQREGEHEVEVDFGLAKFVVQEAVGQFHISARHQGGDATDRLTIRGLSLESGVTYTIGDGDDDVHVSLEVKGITEYATDPKGTFTVFNAFDYDGKLYLLGHFAFVMKETLGEQRDIKVNCYTLQILESD